MKITLVGGRAHQKHTEGGDFRQACYRAVRQGLMEARPVLLEPYYDFRLETPEKMIGRAMADMERMNGIFDTPFLQKGTAVLTGEAPVAALQGYAKELAAYTKGHGRLFCTWKGYKTCHNTEEVVKKIGYEAERDTDNPSGSIFCAHGAGYYVEWDEVKDYMHVESCFAGKGSGEEGDLPLPARRKGGKERDTDSGRWLGTEEVDAILEKTLYANKKAGKATGKNRPGSHGEERKNGNYASGNTRTYGQGGKESGRKAEKKEKYLLVDGYNIIFAWEDLKELAKASIDGARGKLMDILCNYQGIRGCRLILVFDAYRVQGHDTELFDYHNIHVVYTKEAETADQYIEKFAYENGKKADITVATSDGLEQIIIRGQGCALLSARELKEEIQRASEEIRGTYMDQPPGSRNYLLDAVTKETREQLDRIR